MKLARRLDGVSASATLAAAQLAERLKRQGIDVLDFTVGEPDFPTPDHVKAAAVDAIAQNFTKYTAASGTPELKHAICARYRTDYGVEYSPNEVIVTAGGKQALFNAAFALFGPGDEVVTHAPYWPTIVDQLRLVGAKPIIVRTRAEEGFQVSADAILRVMTPQTRGIIINSPGNPTGALMAEAELAKIADAVAGKDVWVVVDLCYERLVYEDVPRNLPGVLTARLRDRTVLAGSASKAYAMTGWRCGWLLGPPEVVEACNTIQSHSTSNVSSITQKAVVAALNGPQTPLAEMLSEYRVRRDKMHAWLTGDGRLRCLKPGGAFYLFPDVTDCLSPDGIRTTTDLATALLEQAHVAVTPGEAFDAPGFLRISYATSMDRLERGAVRIREFVDSLNTIKA